MGDTASLTIELSTEQLTQLKALAKRCKRSTAELVAFALRDYLPDLKKKLDAIEEAEGDLDAGHFIPHEKMVAWLDSWGTDRELPPPEPD